jgi:hypothetical protein
MGDAHGWGSPLSFTGGVFILSNLVGPLDLGGFSL